MTDLVCRPMSLMAAHRTTKRNPTKRREGSKKMAHDFHLEVKPEITQGCAVPALFFLSSSKSSLFPFYFPATRTRWECAGQQVWCAQKLGRASGERGGCDGVRLLGSGKGGNHRPSITRRLTRRANNTERRGALRSGRPRHGASLPADPVAAVLCRASVERATLAFWRQGELREQCKVVPSTEPHRRITDHPRHLPDVGCTRRVELLRCLCGLDNNGPLPDGNARVGHDCVGG